MLLSHGSYLLVFKSIGILFKFKIPVSNWQEATSWIMTYIFNIVMSDILSLQLSTLGSIIAVILSFAIYYFNQLWQTDLTPWLRYIWWRFSSLIAVLTCHGVEPQMFGSCHYAAVIIWYHIIDDNSVHILVDLLVVDSVTFDNDRDRNPVTLQSQE